MVFGRKGALESINDEFHATYDRELGVAESRCTLFVVLGDDLIVRQGKSRRARTFAPETFHVIKSAAHHPIAAYLAAARGDFVSSAAQTRRALEDAERVLEGDARNDVASVLQRTLSFLEHADASAADAFARDVGPMLLRLTDHATRAQLTALHEAVEEELSRLDDEARASLEVVVAGDHQARARSLGMQYFQLRFGEPAGTDRRVTYGEGIESEEEAMNLVAKRGVDRRIARAFFGDVHRLQRDVLGDAAEAILGGANLPPIAIPRAASC